MCGSLGTRSRNAGTREVREDLRGSLMVVAVRGAGTTNERDKRLRVGVIGAGVMGSNHARVFMGLPNLTLVGIADPLEAHRQRAIDLIGCRTFTDKESLLA